MRPLIVVAGVSGVGKTTVGLALAAKLGTAFVDADALHPDANVLKMASGTPLADEDRWPWLAVVGQTLASAPDAGMVVACSALRCAYRDVIRTAAPTATFAPLCTPIPQPSASGSRSGLGTSCPHRSLHRNWTSSRGWSPTSGESR